MAPRFEERIRERASELGFRRVAFTPAGPAPRAEVFRRWLARGFAGEMTWLESEPASRADVTIRSPWARTIVSAAFHYGSPAGRPPFDPRLIPAPAPGAPGDEDRASARAGGGDAGAEVPGGVGGQRPAAPLATGLAGISGLVSRYALGADYHIVVKRRLEELAQFLRAEGGGRVEARCLMDTSAILERDHAAEAGNGWTGKNAMVIDPQAGSWFFLGEILTDLALEPVPGIEDQCGTCTRCVDACPTGAIVEPRLVDSRRCISYLTIELRGAIPAPLRGAVGENLFGCDICQEVCPWNRLAPPPADGALGPGPALTELDLAAAVSLDEAAFAARFRRSPIARARRSGFARNALIVAANRGDAAALQAGEPLLADPDPVVRETAVWALARGEAPQRRAAAHAAAREADPVLRRRMAGEEPAGE